MAMIITVPINCYLSEITELKYTSSTKIIIKEENFKWHLEVNLIFYTTKNICTSQIFLNIHYHSFCIYLIKNS